MRGNGRAANVDRDPVLESKEAELAAAGFAAGTTMAAQTAAETAAPANICGNVGPCLRIGFSACLMPGPIPQAGRGSRP